MLQKIVARSTRAGLGIALLCIGLIAGIWAIVIERTHHERADAIDNVVKRNSNLALAFEEHTIRTLGSVDQAVRFIKREYVLHRGELNVQDMVRNGLIDPRLVNTIGVMNEYGAPVLGMGGFHAVRAKDRDYFRFHRDHNNGELRIGVPLIGRQTGRPTIHMTRRINKPDGKFGGVVLLAANPEYFSDFYRQIDLGRDGVIQLIGSDGIVRVRRGDNASSFGQDLRKSTLSSELDKSDIGSIVTRGRADGIARYLSYRKVRGYPLVVAVSTSVDDALAELRIRQHNYVLSAILATLFILISGGGLVVALSSRNSAKKEKERSESRYRATFDQAAVGIAHVALDGRFLKVNRRLCAKLGYTEEELLARTFPEITHPDDVELGTKAKQHLLSDPAGFASEIEKRLLCKDGGIVWVLAAISMVRGSDGRPDYLVSVVRNITKRKAAEAALRESKQQFKQLADHLPEVLWIKHVDLNQLVYVSPAYEALCGRGSSSLEAGWLDWKSMIHEQDRERVLESYRSMKEGRLDVEHRIVRPDGGVRSVRVRGFPVQDESGKLYRIAGIIEDVTEHKLMQQRLLRQAHYDTLTELPNRALCYDRLAQALAQAKRNDRGIGVLSVALDRFQTVNDTLGHGVGDAALKEAAKRLANCMRAGDTLARVGGDKFVVVLGELRQPQDAHIVAQKILDAMAAPLRIGEQEIFLTASIGIAASPNDGADSETLLKNANAAVLRAKQLGRNNFQFYATEMNERAMEKLMLENDLRRASERGEFFLHFQPRQALGSGRITGFEALLRWERPGKGLVPPGEFVPLLEDSGLIVQVGDWVIEAVCAQISAWQKMGFRPLPVAINLSAKQFLRHDIGAVIEAALRKYGLDASLLEVEITESDTMQSPDKVVATLVRLRERRIRIAIDDFGTGYSSLAYLKRFPVDVLKLDRSFVRGLPADSEDVSIAKAVISMAHSLGLTVVAEGVETCEQRAFLAAHGCDEMQGYLLSPPISAAECQKFLEPPNCRVAA